MKQTLLLIVCTCFLTSIINAQAIRWSNKTVSPGILNEEGFAIAADSLGYTYITGSFKDTVYFGSTMLVGRGLKDIFLVKLDTMGQYMWTKSFGGSSDDEGLGISIDNLGRIYITGYFTTKMFFSQTDSLVSSGVQDIFAARFDNNGNLQLKVRDGNTSGDYGRSIWAHPSNGDFAVVGDIYSNTRLYVAKYNSSGTLLWSKGYTATTATGTGVCMDNAGKVYVSGYFSGNMATPNLTSNSNSIDALCIIFNSAGTTHDYKGNYGSTSSDYAYGITSKSDGGKFFLCGRFTSSINFGNDSWGNPISLTGSGSYAFITGWNVPGATETPEWTQKGPFGTDSYLNIKLDRTGNPVVTDNTIGTVKYMRYGGTSAWVSRPTYTLSTGSSNNSLAIDKKGNVYTTGKFKNTFTFSDSVYVTNNYTSVFVQKISTIKISSPAAGTDKCISSVQGDSMLVSFIPSMPYNSGNIFTLEMDATGTGLFTTPVTLGTMTSSAGGTIHGYIPAGTADNGYFDFRIISSDPATTSGDQVYAYFNDRPIAELSTDTISRCSSGTAVSVTANQTNPNGGGWGYSYQWSPTNYLSAPIGSTTDVYPPTNTTYTVSITDIDNGCVGTATLYAISWPSPTIDVGNDTIICAGTSIMLHATGTNIITYNWTPTATLQNPTTATPIATPTQLTTNYLCQVVSDHGCTNNDQISVTTYTVVANAGPISYNTCLGGAVQLSGTSSGQTYSWTPTTGLSNPSILNPIATPTVTTKYYLTGTSSTYGCIGRDSITINVGPIVVNANDISITCSQNGTLTATPTGNYVTPLTYTWSPATDLSGTTGASVTAHPIENRTYYVVMTTGNGCSGSDSAKVSVSSNFGLAFSVNQQLFTSPPFAAQFTNSTPSPSNYTFTWYWGDGFSTQTGNATVFHVYTYNGNYDVTLVAVNNTTGCIDTLIKTGYIFCMGGTACNLTATVSTPQGTTTCQGDTLSLTCNTGTGYIYQWNLNGNPISGATSSSFGATVQGQYSVTLGDGSCSVVSQTVSLNFGTPPSAPVITKTGSITFCGGGTVFLTANSGYASYQWNTGATTQNITVTQSGTYSVTVSMSAGGCSSSALYDLNASSMPAPDICLVSTDSLTHSNIIVWEPPVSAEIDSFIVYCEGIVADQFERIGAVAYSDLSTFTDNASNPQQQAYRYKLSILDTCEIESMMGNFHKTIHLTINSGMGGDWNLIWNHYEGFAFGTYNIYRGSDSTNMTLLSSIASTFNSYTDIAPPTGLLYYQIEVINPAGCTPNKTWSSSRSNIADNGESPVSVPSQPESINGNSSICEGSSYTYSVSPVSGATDYTWTLPVGWTGSSTTETINIISGAIGGTISITANNVNGSSIPQTLSVIVNTLPIVTLNLSSIDTLCITDPDVTLTGGNPSGGNYSGSFVTGNVFSPSTAGIGNYLITYTYIDVNSCSDFANGAIYVDICSEISTSDNLFYCQILPNPFNSSIEVIINEIGQYKIEVLNVLGERLYSLKVSTKTTHIELSSLSSGIYFVKISNGQNSNLKMIVKQ